MSGSVPTYSLAVAVALALSEEGIDLLRVPRRLVSYVIDVADSDDREVIAFSLNCDEELLVPYVRAAEQGSAKALEDASSRAAMLLSNQRFIVEDFSVQVSRAIASGIAHELGIVLSPEYEIAAIPYDAFVCCREAIEATGASTGDGKIAEQVYRVLTRAGLRVFYPRLSLAKEPLHMHDARCDQALGVAKSLLVVCGDAYNADSLWVRSLWTRYLELHPEEPERVVPCARKAEVSGLPEGLKRMQPCVFDVPYAPRELWQRVVVLAQTEFKMPQSSSQTSSSLAARPIEAKRVQKWQQAQDLRYCVEEVQVEGGKAQLVFFKRTKLGSATVFASFKVLDKTLNRHVRGLCLGEEGYIQTDTNWALQSVRAGEVDASARPIFLTIRWEPVSFADGRLVLRIQNLGDEPCALNDVSLLVDGTPRSMVRLEARESVPAHRTRNESYPLFGWARSVLERRAPFDLYISGRKVNG